MRPDTYGVLVPNSNVVVIHRGLPLGSYDYPSHLPMTIYFGFRLSRINLVEINTTFDSHLHCFKIYRKESLSMDICCLCDGEKKRTSRGRNLLDRVLNGLDSLTKAYYDQLLYLE